MNRLNINPSSQDPIEITRYLELRSFVNNKVRHPEDLGRIDPMLCPLHHPIKEPCLYFWILHGKLVRIGRTNDIARRFYYHGAHKIKPFEIRFLPVPDDFDICSVERSFTANYLPILNVITRSDRAQELLSRIAECKNKEELVEEIRLTLQEEKSYSIFKELSSFSKNSDIRSLSEEE
jgi:hypothetical protein